MITALIDFEARPSPTISFCKNGTWLGVAGPLKGIRADWTGASLAENNGLVLYGSPRSYLYKGSATWCKHCFTSGEKVSPLGALLGGSFGARYGQSVCLVDFNGDGIKDFVVGSPLHSPSIVSTFNPFMLDNYRCEVLLSYGKAHLHGKFHASRS